MIKTKAIGPERRVTFETKCYENDWPYILKGSYLSEMIERCDYPFAKKRVVINNVKNRALVERYARKKVRQGIIDEYVFAEDSEASVLDGFGLSRESFGSGYKYSISELVGIICCDTEYLLHFASDTFMERSRCNRMKPLHWIDASINLLESDRTILTANPLWNKAFSEAESEAEETFPDYWRGYGFSDQCYLIRAKDFLGDIYGDANPASDRYPAYGGNLFEKRIDSYMRNNRLSRITFKEPSYIHANFPKGPLLKFLQTLVTMIPGLRFVTIFRDNMKMGKLLRLMKRLVRPLRD